MYLRDYYFGPSGKCDLVGCQKSGVAALIIGSLKYIVSFVPVPILGYALRRIKKNIIV